MTYDIPPDAPIVCTVKPGEEAAGLEAYRTLFADALVSGERTEWGVRWTFRHDDGIEPRVRELAAMEQACCAFLRMSITRTEDHVVWDVIGPANAREFLDEYAQLPQTVLGGADRLRALATAAGLRFEPMP
jgi:hypothetical protein